MLGERLELGGAAESRSTMLRAALRKVRIASTSTDSLRSGREPTRPVKVAERWAPFLQQIKTDLSATRASTTWSTVAIRRSNGMSKLATAVP